MNHTISLFRVPFKCQWLDSLSAASDSEGNAHSKTPLPAKSRGPSVVLVGAPSPLASEEASALLSAVTEKVVPYVDCAEVSEPWLDCGLMADQKEKKI